MLLSAPDHPMSPGDAWVASDPLPAFWGGGVPACTSGSGQPSRCLGMRVPLALAHHHFEENCEFPTKVSTFQT